MAFKAPSGLMGMPENLEAFEAFEVEDITIYVSKDVLAENLKKDALYIYIEGCGRFLFEIK